MNANNTQNARRVDPACNDPIRKALSGVKWPSHSRLYMTEINPGAVVRLRSGGPNMTVDRIEGHKAFCVWFDDKNSAIRQAFSLHTLGLAGELASFDADDAP